jgi:hypothetical protein
MTMSEETGKEIAGRLGPAHATALAGYYLRHGRTLDDLPYTATLSAIVAVYNEGRNPARQLTNRTAWVLLCYLRKSGRLPKRTTRKSPGPKPGAG